MHGIDTLNLTFLFNQIDKSGDGTLSNDEIRQAEKLADNGVFSDFLNSLNGNDEGVTRAAFMKQAENDTLLNNQILDISRKYAEVLYQKIESNGEKDTYQKAFEQIKMLGLKKENFKENELLETLKKNTDGANKEDTISNEMSKFFNGVCKAVTVILSWPKNVQDTVSEQLSK